MISPEVLRRFSLFAGLSPEIYNDLAMAGEEISLSEGVWLFHEGDSADSLYLLLSGTITLKLAVGSPDNLTEIEDLVQGDMIGWSALVEPHIYTLSAMAGSPVRLVRLDADTVLGLMEDNAEAGFTIMRNLSQAIVKRMSHLRVRFVSLVDN